MDPSNLGQARAAEREGRWEDALALYERALTGARVAGTAVDVAQILRRIATVHAQRDDLEAAEELYETCLLIAELNGLARERSSALMCMAILEQWRGRLETADTFYSRAREVAHELGDLELIATAEQNRGTLANIRGDLETALTRYRSALSLYQQLGDPALESRVLHNMGMAHVDLEEWGAAEQCFDRAFALADQLRDTPMMGNVELNRAELYLRQGRHEPARECCDRAFEIFGRLESDSGLAEVYKFYGVLYRETQKMRLAETHLESAAELAERCEDRLLKAEVLAEQALVHLTEERNREALQCLNQAHRLFEALHAARDLLDLDRRLDGLEATYLRVVRAWGESIESKDRYTAGHCERVANYACMLAAAVGFRGRDLTWLRMGGYLHDVGKIDVPPEVLNKPGKLTAEEWEQMRNHTVAGDAIVSELNFPWDIRPIVRWHHERWDGSGYPDGLRGEEIPLTARILCVADVYDALTTTRSYRAALSREEALRIMEGDAGRIFDPELFATFRALASAASPLPDARFPAFGTAEAAA